MVVIENMTEKEYRKHPAISRSELWHISDSPEKFKYHRDNPKPPTPALLFGQFFHKLVLQPESVWNEFAVEPVVDRRTAQGKKDYAEFFSTLGDKSAVTVDMVATAIEMNNAIMRNGFCRKLLSGAHETAWFWTDETTGIECKCRTDCVVNIGGLPLIVDVKSAQSAATEQFMRDAVKHGYDFQTAMYREGVKANTGKDHGFVFIVVEKEPPYSINILQAEDAFLTRGFDLLREFLGTYKYCLDNDDFYGYMGQSESVNGLNLPPWLAKDIE